MYSFLIIQTAFPGDVVLATAVAEKLHHHYPEAAIDMLVRQDAAPLLQHHPFIREVLMWQKQTNKYSHLLLLARQVRRRGYSHVINLQRFASSGFLTWVSGANFKSGFASNPFSFCYTSRHPHIISGPHEEDILHETQRNQSLITSLMDEVPALPRLYPTAKDRAAILPFLGRKYICLAPASVWHTKQTPPEKWLQLIAGLPHQHSIYLLGGKADYLLAGKIAAAAQHPAIQNLCGQLTFLESAALMQTAAMNYVNDSAPLHLCSAMDAPVTAIYCSTVPRFGFGPLSHHRAIVEVAGLYCKPCGLHGYNRCPEGHFRCAADLDFSQLPKDI